MRPLNDYFLCTRIADVSTNGSEALLPVPDEGDVIKVYSVLGGALSAAAGDATLTCSIDGTAITDGTITITDGGSAEGDIDSCVPSAANHVYEGSYIKIVSDGGSTNAVAAEIVVIIRR